MHLRRDYFSSKDLGKWDILHEIRCCFFSNLQISHVLKYGRKRYVLYLFCAGILEQSMGARNREGIELSYRPVRLSRLAKLIPRNEFLGSLKVFKFGALCFYSVPSTHRLF
jgi:hypothetical protein